MAISRKQIVLLLSIYFKIGFMANSAYGGAPLFCTVQSDVFGLFQETECPETSTEHYKCYDQGASLHEGQICLVRLQDDPFYHFSGLDCKIKTADVPKFICFHHDGDGSSYEKLPTTSNRYEFTSSRTETGLSPTTPKMFLGERDDDAEPKPTNSHREGSRCCLPLILVCLIIWSLLIGNFNNRYKSNRLVHLVVLAVFLSATTGAQGDCTRPVFTNSYAILIHPDKDVYVWYERISMNCTSGHERFGLPYYSYCQQNGTWDQEDPTDGLCLKAQCVSNELVDSDIDVTNSSTGGSHLTTVDNSETAYFSCATLGQFNGATSGTCYNGTFDYYTASDPQCLAYCPFVVADLGAGVSYTIGGEPVYNDTASNRLYYDHGATLDFTCDDGYDNLNCTGQTCESDCKDGLWDPDDFPECHELDECEDNQCKNGASCEDLTNAYKCHCLPGYEGVDCEIDIDECANITCQNGASCEDRINSYVCICAPGYTGDFCETEIDECSSNPCQNNATCNDLFDEYECICLDGFNGTNCENNIDDCANHTCQNGASCIDKVAAYECQCPDGYDGTYCENVVTTPTMTTVIMTTDNTTSLGSTSEPVLTTAEQDVTTSEPTTSLGTTLSSTALTTSTDSSATSVITTDLVATTDTPAAATTVTVAATTITSDTTTISPDASTITPDATTVTSGMATISEGTTAPTVPASTTKTTSVITTEMVVTTDTPAAATTVTSDATTVTPDATTVTSGMTMISKRTTAPAAATTAITAATTVNPDVTTITADATTVSPGTTTISEETTAPTTPASTTKSDSPTLSVSTSSLSETTESKETTATSTKSPTEPQTTEKPPTPLPCGGECLPTQVCNSMDQCECRPDYYEDEDDNEEPCKVPTSIDVTMTITAVNGTEAVYKEEYANPESDEFKALEEDVCQPFNEIYRNESDYEGCRVIEFTNGSIIVNYVLTFVQNSTISVSDVNHTVYDELLNPNGSYTGELEFDDSSFSIAPLDECEKGIDNCIKNTNCTDQGEKGYTCECFTEVHVLPGQECPEPTEPPPITTEEPEEPGTATEPPPTPTEEPEEPGMEVWKVVVGVTVPIVGILTITIVGLVCWQYRRLDRTSPVSESTKLRTRPYQEDIGDSDRDASRPGSMMIMNNDGTVQEVVLPWRNDSSEGEFIFAPDIDSKGKNQMLPMVDYPSNYGPSSYDNDPLGNIVSSYDNYTYQNHDTRNTTEIDSRYF